MDNYECEIKPPHCNLFFVTFFLSLFYTFAYQHTLWWGFRDFCFGFKYITFLSSVLLLCSSLSSYKSNQSAVIISISLLIIIVVWNSDEYFGYVLWILFALTVGSKGLNFRSIIRCHLYVEVCFCLVNIISNAMGWTDKTFLFTGDEREDMFGGNVVTRFSAGYPAATDFATHVLFIVLDYWILKNGILKIAEYVLFSIIIYSLIAYCDARQASGCLILLILCSLFVSYLERKQSMMNKWLGRFLIMGIPLFFFISLYATMSYDSSDMGWVAADILLSGRLQLGLEAIEKYGIPWFGQNITFIGGGFSNTVEEYDYVDCAYVQFLLRWGPLVMALFLLGFVKTGMDAFRRNDAVLIFSLFIAGVSAMITQFLFHLNYCILILALTAVHNVNGETPNLISDAGISEG